MSSSNADAVTAGDDTIIQCVVAAPPGVFSFYPQGPQQNVESRKYVNLY